MNSFMKTQKQIETQVVSGYQAIERTVVGCYKKIEDRFVAAFLTPDNAENQAKESEHERNDNT
jgi:hypothetical protein